MDNAQCTMTIALIVLATLTWSCTGDELAPGGSPAPVTITAHTAGFLPSMRGGGSEADGGVTRATSNIKTTFHTGDKIGLSTDGGSTFSYATLQPDGTWATPLTLPTDGTVTSVTAAYTTGLDWLTATATTTNGGLTLGADPITGKPVWNIALNFTHDNAVVDVQVYDPDMANLTQQMQSITIGGKTHTSPTDILLAPTATLGDVIVRVNGIDYTANSDARLVANTRYTIIFICDPVKPTITITANAPTWGDGGSTEVPMGYDYVISNLDELKAWNTAMQTPANLGQRAIQIADITWDDSETWTPVGTDTNPFTGVYNGNGYKITGLKIGVVGSGTSASSGMFGSIGGSAVLAGIHLRGANITNTGAARAGLLVGSCQGTGVTATISLCSATGKITLDTGANVGGLVGRNYNAGLDITRCYADVAIEVDANNVSTSAGGLIGSSSGTNANIKIVACGANANIVVTNAGNSINGSAGGLAGTLLAAVDVCYCYATGTTNVTGDSSNINNGGLVGMFYSNTNISYSYTTVTVTTIGNNGKTGSFAGFNYAGADASHAITSCHATGANPKKVGNMTTDPTTVLTTDNGTERRGQIEAGETTTTVRTVQYDATTGYAALGTIPTKTFSGTKVWTTGATPDINYLKYNGEQ